jgi:hypothetical protein
MIMGSPLKPIAGNGVKNGEGEKAHTGSDQDDVEHDVPRAFECAQCPRTGI